MRSVPTADFVAGVFDANLRCARETWWRVAAQWYKKGIMVGSSYCGWRLVATPALSCASDPRTAGNGVFMGVG